MAFGKYIPTENENYLGYSKGVEGPKPNLALAKLFEGVGSTLDVGLKGATDVLDIKIDNEARRMSDESNNVKDLTLEDAATLGKLKNKAERGTLLGSDSPNTSEAPMEVTQGLTKLDKLYQQYQQGQLSPTYWLTQQQVIAQQLKQRFPGSEKEIDTAIHRATAPANAIRSQLFADFQAASAGANTVNKQWDSWVDKNSQFLGEQGIRVARDPSVYGNRQLQTEIMAKVAGQEEYLKKMSTRHSEMSNDILKGQVDQHKAESSLLLDLTGKVSTMMTGALNPLTGLQKQIDKAAETGEFTPEFITAANAQLTQMERALDAQFDQHINSTRFEGGQSYASTIRDPAIISKAKNFAKEDLTRLKDAINNNDTGLVSYFAKNLERVKDYSANDLLKNNGVLRRLASFEKAVGGQGNITGKLLLDNKVLSDIWNAAAARNTANKITGEGSPAMAMEPQEGKDPPPQVPKLEMKHIETLITDPQSTPEMRKNAITYLTNDKEGDFFKALDKPSQLQAFNTLTNTNIAKSAYENGPESWGKYKDWGQNSFNRLTMSRAGDLKTVLQNDKLKYNTETNQLEYITPNNLGGINYPELQSVLQINNGLRNLSNIYTLDKTDLNAKVAPMFKGLGIPILQPTAGEGTKATPYAPEKQTPEAIKAIDDALKTNLEPGKTDSHIKGMTPELKTGLAAMLKDAPEGVQIFSGHRSEERQQELFTAAVKKYGSVAEARRWVAPPGYSMHNHGNAADLKFASAEAKSWVHANAAKYGLHFPLRNEPWHVEPAGSR